MHIKIEETSIKMKIVAEFSTRFYSIFAVEPKSLREKN